jgi:glycosyltransferase involved in cell wall biosynthesis
MKDVSILISNYNSFDAIQLCVESIRARTDYPNYQIIVHDDESPNGVDLPYLEAAEKRGWLRLIRGNKARWSGVDPKYPARGACYWHGCALNVLLNEVCDTDFAFLMDCDIYIKDRSWLRLMVDAMDDETLLVMDEWPPTIEHYWNNIIGRFLPWFGLINMAAYNDGMRVDWRHYMADAHDEPYRTLMARAENWKEERHINKEIFMDTGANLWVKFMSDNPKGYRAKPLPAAVKAIFHHYEKISTQAKDRMAGSMDNGRYVEAQEDLRKLRMEAR